MDCRALALLTPDPLPTPDPAPADIGLEVTTRRQGRLVSVMTLSGTKFKLEVQETDKILNLKLNVYHIEGILPEQQTYFYAHGGKAEDWEPLICLEDGHHMPVSLEAGWMICVSCPRDPSIQLVHLARRHWGDQISTLREEVRSTFAISLNVPLRLVYAGWTLNDGMTLADYYIPSGSRIVVLLD